MIGPYVRGGYNFDGCTPEVVLTRMSVQDGRIVLPDGMSYRVLVLPQVETMTPALLRKIKELVVAGATVVAPSGPQKSPGLSHYPACDEQVKELAADCGATARRQRKCLSGPWAKVTLFGAVNSARRPPTRPASSRSSAPRNGSGTKKGTRVCPLRPARDTSAVS